MGASGAWRGGLLVAGILAVAARALRPAATRRGHLLTDSFLPVAAQVLEHVVDHIGDAPKSVHRSESVSPADPSRDEAAEAYKLILGRLKNSLAAEARLRGLNAVDGFSDALLERLRKMKPGTSKEQVESLLKLIAENRESNWKPVTRMSKFVLQELHGNDTELGEMLSRIKPIKYT